MFGVLAILIATNVNPVTPFVSGTASYYTVASSSSLTASGEFFRDSAYTCAMLQGEFGEHFLVVADNGRSVIVKLNDRGPFHPNRVIDLSKAAMRKLTDRKGLIKVKVYKLGKDFQQNLRI